MNSRRFSGQTKKGTWQKANNEGPRRRAPSTKVRRDGEEEEGGRRRGPRRDGVVAVGGGAHSAAGDIRGRLLLRRARTQAVSHPGVARSFRQMDGRRRPRCGPRGAARPRVPATPPGGELDAEESRGFPRDRLEAFETALETQAAELASSLEGDVMVFNLVEALRDALAEETLGGSGEGTAGDPAAREGARGGKSQTASSGAGGADADGAERARRTEPGTRSGTSTTSARRSGTSRFTRRTTGKKWPSRRRRRRGRGDAAPRGLPTMARQRLRAASRRRASRRSSRSRSRRRRRERGESRASAPPRAATPKLKHEQALDEHDAASTSSSSSKRCPMRLRRTKNRPTKNLRAQPQRSAGRLDAAANASARKKRVVRASRLVARGRLLARARQLFRLRGYARARPGVHGVRRAFQPRGCVLLRTRRRGGPGF